MCTEASGVVTEVGSKVRLWRVGQGVMLGLSAMGSAAEQMVCNERALLPKPSLWSYAEAAAFPVGFITTYHALVHRGHLLKGETLLITGAAGGMGASCIQLGKKLGATVIACASSAEKLELCKQLGADHVIDYKTENIKDRVTAITKGKMVDVVYDVVGGDIFDHCVRVMAPGGRLLVIGFTSGVIPK
jgi:NADPH2:quinone reductase